ncbi:MAG: DNRLRE domain-containing protein [Verrucomicrobiota bacterium]
MRWDRILKTVLSFASLALYSTSVGQIALPILDDAYLETGSRKTDNYLKVEAGNRTSYLKIDLSDLPETIYSATLKMTVAGDPGSGSLNLHRGSSTNWTENDLNSSNAPVVETLLQSVSGIHANGETLSFDLTQFVADLGESTLSLVLTMESGGNDVWFGSSRSVTPPEFLINQTDQEETDEEPPPAETSDATGAFLESGGLVVMEMESAETPLDQWVSRTNLSGYSGSSYLEFTGNSPISGPPRSPLEFDFVINSAGLYYLHLHCAKEIVDGRTDLANDCYVRMEGDFGAGPNAGNSHGKDAPLDMLQDDTKFFGGQPDEFDWTYGNHLDPGGEHNKRVAIYDFKAGERYKLVVHGRSQRFKIDRIVFRRSDVAVNVAHNLNQPESERSSGNENPTEEATFDKAKDILIAQFDNKPDADDLMAQAALGSMLLHSDLEGVNYYAVTGAYGTQGGSYIDSRSLFEIAFGAENEFWTDADLNWNASIERIRNKTKPILQNGGRVWVQEAGQSDLTRDWIESLLADGISGSLIKSHVTVVQHSDWNEGQTSDADLDYVRSKTNYVAIDDGNQEYGSGQTRGPHQTPKYVSEDENWLQDATSPNNPNPRAQALWQEAHRIITEANFSGGYSVIPQGGVDFSDCVENWWIFEIESDADSVEKFWNRYVVNDSPINNPDLRFTYDFDKRLLMLDWKESGYKLQVQEGEFKAGSWADHPDGAEGPTNHSLSEEQPNRFFFRLYPK